MTIDAAAVADYELAERAVATRRVTAAHVLGYPAAMLKRAYEPCLPTIAKTVPIGPQWLHELKHDGFRLIVHRDGDTVRLFEVTAAILAPNRPTSANVVPLATDTSGERGQVNDSGALALPAPAMRRHSIIDKLPERAGDGLRAV